MEQYTVPDKEKRTNDERTSDAEYIEDLEHMLWVITRTQEEHAKENDILIKNDVNASYRLLRRRGFTKEYSRFETKPDKKD